MKMIIDIDEKVLKDMENGYICTSELVQAVKNGKSLEKKKEEYCGNCKHYEPCIHYCITKNMSVTYSGGKGCSCFQSEGPPSK